jgi:hypothetical protein
VRAFCFFFCLTEEEGHFRFSDIQTCRKLLFADYFQHSGSGKSVAAFQSAGEDKKDCGHCDNVRSLVKNFQRLKDMVLSSANVILH